MTPADHRELLDIAKAVSSGTAGQYPPESYPLLRDVAGTLAALGWDRAQVCPACPRHMHAHACGCPHAQARKRLRAFGVWPEGTGQ